VKKLIQNRKRPLLYAITDRLTLPRRNSGREFDALIEFIKRALAAGVDMIQIRERDLSARDLLFISDSVKESARERGACLLVNDRADVAACAGIGVHLAARSISPDVARKAFGQRLLIGASTHNMAEAERAERAGADFIVFGPVFETESKKKYGPPVGVQALRTVASRISIPVIALGGINSQNFRDALAAGASGIAGISLFSSAGDLDRLARTIKASIGGLPQ
jgi:thiamine-phosphate pyrophosphorylase